MKIQTDSDRFLIGLEMENKEQFQAAMQVLSLFETDGLAMMTTRELPTPNLETRPGGAGGDVLVMTWSRSTFASVPLASISSGKPPERLEARQISLPLVNEAAVNAWWMKHKETIVDRWLKSKDKIPHRKGGFLGGLKEFLERV